MSVACSVLLAALLAAAQVFSASGELALLVARGNTGSELDLCAVFSSNTTYWSSVATSGTPTDFHPGLYLADFPCTCEDIVPGSWLGKAVIVDRGAGQRKCTTSIYQKGQVAQCANASLLVVIVNESTVDPPPTNINDNTSSSVPLLSLPVVLVSSAGQELKPQAANLSLAVYIPSRPPLDPCTALIFIIAVGTVLLGAFIANTPFEFMRYGLLVRKGDATSDSASQNDTKKTTMVVSMVMIAFSVGCIIGLLLLLFFFYYPMVYVVIALYCCGATVGLYALLAPFIGLIPFGQQLRVPVNRFNFRPDVWYFILVPVCAGFVLWWVLERHAVYAWVLQDILGFAFITFVMKKLFVLKSWVIAVLMSVLFFYDIFMVFITPYFTTSGVSIMEQAALGPRDGNNGAVDRGYGGNVTQTEQIPVIFKVPRLLYPTNFDTLCEQSNFYSILGYGDVGIPGLLVCVCLKFDLIQRKGRICKLYYAVSALAYAVGLLVTFVALSLMQSAQPALLYLVPATLGSVIVLSLVRKEFFLFFTGKPRVKKPNAVSLSNLQVNVEEGGGDDDGGGSDVPDTDDDTKTLIRND